MPNPKTEAIQRLAVAIDRCRGDSIPISTETADALGLKKGAKSISKEDAQKLIESGDGGRESGGEEDPPQKATKTKKAKAADKAPEEPPAPPAGEDPLSDA